MLGSLWRLFEGTSGHRKTYWPPLAVAGYLEPEKNPAVECTSEKVNALGHIRRRMRQHGVGIYLVMEQDEHQSEYVADSDRRIRFVSGFTGSAAFISIGLDWAELATDSRYYVIASRQLSPEWHLRKLGLPGIDPWEVAVVKRAAEAGVDVGVDPRFINADVAEKLQTALGAHKRKLVPLTPNLVDQAWGSLKPELPPSPIVSQPLSLSGEPAESKIRALRTDMAQTGARSFVVYSLEEVAWILNLRGGDIPYVPIFKSFLVVTADDVTLYCDVSKLSLDISHHEGVKVTVKKYDKFFTDISGLKKPIWIPGKGSWAIFKASQGKTRVNKTISEFSPVNLRRAIKNSVEIQGIREAQLKCSLSIVKYFSWLALHLDEEINEYDGGLKLLEIRKQLPDFRGSSFETISSAGPNASAPHYAPEPTNSRVISDNEVYLLDSGSHFLQGSTDITRTVHFGKPTREEIQAYTLVLKGQLAVSSAVFPSGTNGSKLDILARQFLWENGMDYGHGTGHGIGSYLNIHELPLGIGISSGPESNLLPGHFISDEPGYYKDDAFGIRLENDILVVDHSMENTDRQFLTFEVMTLVPYEPKLIDVSLLTSPEKERINEFHQKCRSKLRPHLHENYEIDWLERCTARIV